MPSVLRGKAHLIFGAVRLLSGDTPSKQVWANPFFHHLVHRFVAVNRITVVTAFHASLPQLHKMESQRLSALVEQLDDNIDDLEEQLAPLLSNAFSSTTKKLPVLDRAKLYVLITYTIESILFCM